MKGPAELNVVLASNVVRDERFGMVVLEAMSAGLVVIATPTGAGADGRARGARA